MTPKTILVTGANGFVAGHILEALLRTNYNVRGTVRSTSAGDKVKGTYEKFVIKLHPISCPRYAR